MPANHPDDDRLIAHALDELDVIEAEAFTLHLGQCTSCAQQATQLANLLTTVRDRAPSPAPVGGLVKLLEHQASRRHRRDWVHSRPLQSLAAGVVIAILAFGAGHLQGRRGVADRQSDSRASRGGSAARKTHTMTPNLVPIGTIAPGDLGMVVASSHSIRDSAAIRDSM